MLLGISLSLKDEAGFEPKVMRRIFRSYVNYLARADDPAATLCRVGVPIWVVHAEKGDGGLTKSERLTLQTCPDATVVTLPGSSFLIPNEEPEQVASCIVEALDCVG